ncbi:ABC transporter substrate-binding protein [Chloroflexota bacterium]
MKRKILWMGLSFLMVATLVLTSCGPTVEEGEVEEEAPAEGEPRYGGELTIIYNWPLTVFDPAVAGRMGIPEPGMLRLTNDTGHIYDWGRGPAGGYGTNEFDFQTNGFNGLGQYEGSDAWGGEWEAVTPTIFRLKIKPGIHYGLNPDSEASRLVNGRELTVDDVIKNYVRYIYTPESYFYPHQTSVSMREGHLDPEDPFVWQSDDWEITCEFPMHIYHSRNRFIVGWRNYIFPPEVWETYGDIHDWRNVVGTGPYMLTDFVEGSNATLIRNPNWWKTNPVGPGKGDQLPYIDTLKVLIILDDSTRLAALRTAQTDWLSSVPLDNALELMESEPDIMYDAYMGEDSMHVDMRTDKEPFNDIRVRQALMMAINYDEIIDDIYSGKAEKNVFPIMREGGPASVQNRLVVAMEDYPPEVQELWSYNPEKARQLLADAGVPPGFKTSINIQNVVKDIDVATVLQRYWSDIGVDVEIAPRERAVMLNEWRNYDAMRLYWGSTAFVYGTWSTYVGESASWVDDPVMLDYFERAEAVLGMDDAAAVELWRDAQPHAQGQVYAIEWPQPYQYVFWWPWIKNYSGELNLDQRDNNISWTPYVWIDEDLKAEMGH